MVSTICKPILRNRTAVIDQAIRIDKPTPTRIIIPALEVIQPGLYGANLAVGIKSGEKKMEITRINAVVFNVPGEGYLSRAGKGIHEKRFDVFACRNEA